MRKQEYLHVHALLVEVSRHLGESEGLPAERLSAYDALETRPSSVHASKQDHHDAVMTLARDIDRWIERASDDRPDLTVT